MCRYTMYVICLYEAQRHGQPGWPEDTREMGDVKMRLGWKGPDEVKEGDG